MKTLIILVTTVLAATACYSQENDWTVEENKVLIEYDLDHDESRGIVLVSTNHSAHPIDYKATNIKDALRYYLAAEMKKDLIYVSVENYSSIPEQYRKPIGIHKVVTYYLSL